MSEQQQEHTLSRRALALSIPTNPTVSPDVDPASIPEGALEYANPVALNNRMLFLANASIDLADQLERALTEQRDAKLAKRKAERELEQYESRLLRSFPLGTKQNTLKAIAAHLQMVAFEKDCTGEQYDDLREAVEKAEDRQISADARVSMLKMWDETIQNTANNISIHLSKVKADMSFNGGGRR